MTNATEKQRLYIKDLIVKQRTYLHNAYRGTSRPSALANALKDNAHIVYFFQIAEFPSSPTTQEASALIDALKQSFEHAMYAIIEGNLTHLLGANAVRFVEFLTSKKFDTPEQAIAMFELSESSDLLPEMVEYAAKNNLLDKPADFIEAAYFSWRDKQDGGKAFAPDEMEMFEAKARNEYIEYTEALKTDPLLQLFAETPADAPPRARLKKSITGHKSERLMRQWQTMQACVAVARHFGIFYYQPTIADLMKATMAGESTGLESVMSPAEIEAEFNLAEGTVRQYLTRHADEMIEKGEARKADERSWHIMRSAAKRIWGK